MPGATSLADDVGNAFWPTFGTIRITVSDETAELTAGDSCSYRTDAPHGVENPDLAAEAPIYLIIERP